MLHHQGFKGVGKGSYRESDAVMSGGESSANEPTTQSSIPDPIKFTEEEIQEKMDGQHSTVGSSFLSKASTI